MNPELCGACGLYNINSQSKRRRNELSLRGAALVAPIGREVLYVTAALNQRFTRASRLLRTLIT